MPRSHNKLVDVLATLSSKVGVPNEVVDVKAIKKTFLTPLTDSISTDVIDEHDWRSSVVLNIKLHIQLLL